MKRRSARSALLGAGVGLLLCAAAQAAPEERITITGDQELPSVLYVLPWRTPTLQPVLEPVLDNPALAPLGPCDTGPAVAPLPGCGPARTEAEDQRGP